MKNSFALNQNSSNEVLASYFKKVFQLEKSGEAFPVDLDDVWMLVYGRRDNAIAALRENFMQHIDYQFSLKNQEKSGRGRPTTKYQLSVSCLEYFIARKVRPVFEVYRRATHAYKHRLETENNRTNFCNDDVLETLEMKVKLLRRHHERMDRIESKMVVIDAKLKTRTDEFTVAGFATLIGIPISRQMAATIGKRATAICRKKGYHIERIYDPRFGKVNVYPKEVLLQLFRDIFGDDFEVPDELL